MNRKLILLVAFFLIFIAACSGGAEPQPKASSEDDATTADLLPIRITRNPFLSNAPLFIALEEGYFEEQGLDVEFVSFEVTSDALPALIQGNVDVWAGATDIGVWNAIADGAGIKVVANKGYYPPGSCYGTLLGAKALEETGGLSNPDAIYGKQIAYLRGSFSEYWLQEVFAAEGLDITQVEAAAVPIPAVPEVLGEGDLVLALGIEPTTTFALRSGNAYVERLIADDLPNFEFAHVIFGPSILDENPELGQRFMVAYMQAVRQYSEGKTERNLEILNETLGLDRDVLEDACWPDFVSDLSVNYESLTLMQVWAVENGYQDEVLTAEQMIDLQFVEYALETLGE